MSGVADLLGLPQGARTRHRLTKKEIAGQYGGTSPADARLLTKVVVSAIIVGVLRPETVSVPAYRDVERRVDFIPVLDLIVAEGSRKGDITRAVELLHRSVPRPTIIALRVPGGEELLSVALTRLSKSDAGQETSVIEAALLVPSDHVPPGALAIRRLDRADLWALYRDLVRTIAADGRPSSSALTAMRAVALRRRLEDLDTEVDAVVRDAKREKNVQRQIDLNAAGKQLRAEREGVYRELYAPTPPPTSSATDESRNS